LERCDQGILTVSSSSNFWAARFRGTDAAAPPWKSGALAPRSPYSPGDPKIISQPKAEGEQLLLQIRPARI
jgi:hypothetical protein